MKFTTVLDAAFARISENEIIKAIRQGLLYIMPLIMVGSFVLMVLNLPIPAINTGLSAIFGEHWRTFGLAIHKGTFRIMSLCALMAVSYALASERKASSGNVNPIIVLLTALSCYITFNPETESVMDENATGPTGMFGAIVIAILSTYLFLFFQRRLPRKLRVYAFDSDAILLSSLSHVLPVLLTVAVFSAGRLCFDQLGITQLVASASGNVISALLKGGTGLATVIAYVLLTHIMWFFGIHGTNVMEQLAQDLFVAASEQNIALAAMGEEPTRIITKEFFDIFVFLGGSGCTMGLLIALLFAGRSSNASGLAKYSIFPGLFNINEVMVYGLPIIFNPYYLAPFLLTPVVLSASSYVAFRSGLVPLTITRVVWTTPIFISGYASTGSAAGVVLQLFNLLLAAVIYLPFVRLYERQISRNNLRVLEQLSQAYLTARPEHPPRMLGRSDELGMIARSLATELRGALGEESSGLHMEFQPKTRSDGRVVGAEALLRWNHPTYGAISPQVVLGIAEEAELTVELGAWVMEASFIQLVAWRGLGYNNVTLSVNISPEQLRLDDALAHRLRDIVERFALEPGHLELELTEHTALDQSTATRGRLELLKEMGVNIAIDDFGMGNSSILYLRDFYANVVKLDMSLVHAVNENVQSQEIVRSIVSLCGQLGVGVVAEGVETPEQLAVLEALGCGQFQGWLFSRALPAAEFVRYMHEHGTVEDALQD